MSEWDTVGRALRERRPRYPYEALVSCVLLVTVSVADHHGWLDLVFATLGGTLAGLLTVRHWSHVATWRSGVDSFRRITGRDP